MFAEPKNKKNRYLCLSRGSSTPSNFLWHQIIYERHHYIPNLLLFDCPKTHIKQRSNSNLSYHAATLSKSNLQYMSTKPQNTTWNEKIQWPISIERDTGKMRERERVYHWASRGTRTTSTPVLTTVPHCRALELVTPFLSRPKHEALDCRP